MIGILSTNITSPLGLTTEENYQAVRSGCSALTQHEHWMGVEGVFTASTFSEEQSEKISAEGFTRFESLALRSAEEALSSLRTELNLSRTLFVLSTTKANVEELAECPEKDGAYLSPGASARKIAGRIGVTGEPLVVCNACISGVSALWTAHKLIESGCYDTAIVCGADCLTPFVVAGFLSFMALSREECRPFDLKRNGLNLGEAAATVILSRCDEGWGIASGALNNDAYHVSAPSPKGDGVYGVVVRTMSGHDASELATVCAHGTATMFNDQMESKAIERASLSDIPVSALKGYYGHTLGAAGILETILTLRALDDGYILPVRGFDELGVSGRIEVCNRMRQTDRRSFLKIISGFGGCNGALLLSRNYGEGSGAVPRRNREILHCVSIKPSEVILDGRTLPVRSEGKELLAEVYRTYIGDYPKFYKMDVFSKLAFLAAELLAQSEGDKEGDGERRGVLIFNASSSIVADRAHLATICDERNFFPSPSVFLYTLPNIVTGEIALKRGYKGETSLFILDGRNDEMMERITDAAFLRSDLQSVITGWADCPGENDFEAELRIEKI